MVSVDQIGIEAELAFRHERDARLSFIIAELTRAMVACETGLTNCAIGLTNDVETKAAASLDRARRAFDAATVASNKVEMSEVERKWFVRKHSLARTRLRELAEQLFRFAAGRSSRTEDPQGFTESPPTIWQGLFRSTEEKNPKS